MSKNAVYVGISQHFEQPIGTKLHKFTHYQKYSVPTEKHIEEDMTSQNS